MPQFARNRADFSSLSSYWLLVGFLVILWIAGGSSRADVSGQVVVRFFAWLMLVAGILVGPRIDGRRVQMPAIFLGLSIGIVALQLIPLPPAVWLALPSRELLALSAELAGQPQPWRPLSLSPGPTVNALASLVVPAVTLLLAAHLTFAQHKQIAMVMLALVVAGSIVGLLQFSGANFDNPLINELRGFVAGNFANRNHFALFVAIGCVLALTWGFQDGSPGRWRSLVAVSSLPFFVLVILATGSRSGIALGVIAIAAGLLIGRKSILRELRHLSRTVAIGVVAALAALLGMVVALAITLGRAEGFDRSMTLEAGADLRARALPVLLDMVGMYFPAGSGFGTFDSVYRITEPDALLMPVYFNHAHNDLLEIILEGGLAGALLLFAALVWWFIASLRAWRSPGPGQGLARAGSTICLLILVASVTDYPARTPMMMAVLVLAAIWLGNRDPGERGSRAPADARFPNS